MNVKIFSGIMKFFLKILRIVLITRQEGFKKNNILKIWYFNIIWYNINRKM